MLSAIDIQNLVIVEQLSLEFEAGMSALTGETGAGKSILIDALGLALGERADSGMIRHGADRAEITASFRVGDTPAAIDWLREQALDSDDECLLRRVLVRDGRSRAFINGRPVTLQTLQQLGQLLVDIHGQHAHQSLLKRSAQRQLLDAFGQYRDALQQTADSYRNWRTGVDELAQLTGSNDGGASKLELLRFQLTELEALELADDELAQLDQQLKQLANADQLQQLGYRLAEQIRGEDGSLDELLSRIAHDAEELVRLDPATADIQELIDSAQIQLREAAGSLQHYAEGIEGDPQALAQVEQRLAAIHDMARKYRVPPEQLIDRCGQIRDELNSLESLDQRIAELQRQIEQQLATFQAKAAKLSACRQAKAGELQEQINSLLPSLGMAGARLEIQLQPLSLDQASANGLDSVQFQVATNPGQPLAPLQKVASGGELSRISLAIQVASSGCASVPTLIFDEVDVGVGGATAQIVGQLLRQLGQQKQVLCVTHLPQVAAQANHHFRVEKASNGKSTVTAIAPIVQQARVEEIARMLGGVNITEQTRAHAEEMLASASG